jgi:hypothetical protein
MKVSDQLHILATSALCKKLHTHFISVLFASQLFSRWFVWLAGCLVACLVGWLDLLWLVGLALVGWFVGWCGLVGCLVWMFGFYS